MDDRIAINPGTITLAASTLLANDLDFQNLANPQSLKLSWVGDAIGGSVSLSADKQTVTFTPAAGYQGSLEFAYQVIDSAGHTAPVLINSLDPSQQGPLKARVLLTPANAPNDPDYAKQGYLGAINAPQARSVRHEPHGTCYLVVNGAVRKLTGTLRQHRLRINASYGLPRPHGDYYCPPAQCGARCQPHYRDG